MVVDLNTKEGPSAVVVGGRIGSQDVPKHEASVSCYLLARYMEREDKIFSQLVKKFPAFYGNPKVHYSIHKWPVQIQK